MLINNNWESIETSTELFKFLYDNYGNDFSYKVKQIFENHNSDLKEENEILQNEINELENEINNLECDIYHLEDKIDDLQDELNEERYRD